MKYSFPKIVEILTAGQGLALATIIETEGSTPQITGSSAVFSRKGLEAGTVGGGFLEARVEAIASRALGDGKARLVSIRLDADPSDMEGAVCGGAARVLIDPGVGREKAVYRKALDAFRKRRPGGIVAGIKTVKGAIVAVQRRFFEAEGENVRPVRGQSAGRGFIAAVDPETLGASVKDGRTRLIRSKGRLVFLEPVRPLPRLIIAGAGHIGRAVARQGSLLDWSVTVIDDRLEFANARKIPEADELVVGEIGETLRRIDDSPDNYFVIATRGHEKDAEALRAVLGRPAAYIGMIGSKRKIETMHRAFLEAGWATAEEWGRLHAPIGLDIGSQTVEEIAVSIAAELVLVRSGRKKGGRP